jgi:hypothetical protein
VVFVRLKGSLNGSLCEAPIWACAIKHRHSRRRDAVPETQSREIIEKYLDVTYLGTTEFLTEGPAGQFFDYESLKALQVQS